MKSREEEIRYRAHLIWLAEGQPDGRDREHWKQAEEIVNQMPSIVPDSEERVLKDEDEPLST
jgi:hypothetical protein